MDHDAMDVCLMLWPRLSFNQHRETGMYPDMLQYGKVPERNQ